MPEEVSFVDKKTSEESLLVQPEAKKANWKARLLNVWILYCGFSVGDFLNGVVGLQIPHFDFKNFWIGLAFRLLGMALFLGILKLAGKKKRVLCCAVVCGIQVGFLLTIFLFHLI